MHWIYAVNSRNLKRRCQHIYSGSVEKFRPDDAVEEPTHKNNIIFFLFRPLRDGKKCATFNEGGLATIKLESRKRKGGELSF